MAKVNHRPADSGGATVADRPDDVQCAALPIPDQSFPGTLAETADIGTDAAAPMITG